MRNLKPSERLVDKAYSALRQAVLSGELKPGDALSVPELSRQLGVSRSPVREAVLQLVADGLAQEEARKGAMVAQFGFKDALYIIEVREALEIAAIRLGAERATAGDFAALRQVLSEQTKSIEAGSFEGYETTDLRFHKLIGSLSHNPVLERSVGVLKDQFHLALEPAARKLAQLERGLHEHTAIVEALETRDSNQAARLMAAHFKRIRNSLEEWIVRQASP
jgi:DNA-binding GntR family transcriptional regulator